MCSDKVDLFEAGRRFFHNPEAPVVGNFAKDLVNGNCNARMICARMERRREFNIALQILRQQVTLLNLQIIAAYESAFVDKTNSLSQIKKYISVEMARVNIDQVKVFIS